ncbi:hypothetical protein INS49_011049 [Diaporthe citri]|uniref:uncharacterized protein n=1 Tax=Diaporthe citri TaxID=83186 RepID=UPI001C7EEB67|nr:uncharacterized protein INS49_011049 [Diaporthe citri]KAG6359993.1 hypothetical protein INS49_011049 [Diaporthe citri]
MDTIKKVLHPKEPTHQTHDTNEPAASHHNHPSSSLPPGARPDQETLDRLGSEPNVTGTNRPPPHEDFPSAHTAGDQPKINRGHHHPRQPVGATGPPAGHGGAGSGAVGAESGAHGVKAQAEEGNNFPGTNPHPNHSA